MHVINRVARYEVSASAELEYSTSSVDGVRVSDRVVLVAIKLELV